MCHSETASTQHNRTLHQSVLQCSTVHQSTVQAAGNLKQQYCPSQPLEARISDRATRCSTVQKSTVLHCTVLRIRGAHSTALYCSCMLSHLKELAGSSGGGLQQALDPVVAKHLEPPIPGRPAKQSSNTNTPYCNTLMQYLLITWPNTSYVCDPRICEPPTCDQGKAEMFSMGLEHYLSTGTSIQCMLVVWNRKQN